MRRLLSLFLLLAWVLPAQALFHWMTGRPSPEGEWHTLASEHFAVHYPAGLDSTARRCLDTAEMIYSPVCGQLGLEPDFVTQIAITDADRIVNGFAFPQHMAIWVHQNDYAERFSQNRDWLRQVIAHEFQHVLTFHALRDWRGQMGLLLSGVPAWWMEGLAEYYTENWNVLRSDADLRAETLDRRLARSDPHDAGYARVLYLAWRDGDSTLVQITRWRDKRFRTHSFKKAFRAVTGQSLASFNEEWLRTMNALYNAELAAGEQAEEIGERLRLPIRHVRWLELAADSSAWFVIGRRGSREAENALYRVACDSTQQVELLAEGQLSGRGALLDGGLVFDRRAFDRGGRYSSDLYYKDFGKGEVRRITRDGASDDPAASANGALAWIREKDGRSLLMLRDSLQGPERVLWDPGPGWQLLRPRFSPDGRRIALAVDDAEQLKDIVVVDCAGGTFRRLQRDPRDDRRPVWITDSLLVFTAFDAYRANLERVSLSGERSQVVTRSGEGLFSETRTGERALVASLLDSAGVSRLLRLDALRTPRPVHDAIAPRWKAWREGMPDVLVPDHAPPRAKILRREAYSPWNLRPQMLTLLPWPIGVVGVGVFIDPLARNTVALSAGGGHPDFMDPGATFSWQHRKPWGTLSAEAVYNWEPEVVLEDGELLTRQGSSLGIGLGRLFSLHPYPRLFAKARLGLRLSSHERVYAPGPVWQPPQKERTGELALRLLLREAPREREALSWPSRGQGLLLGAGLHRSWILGDEDLEFLRAEVYRLQPLGGLRLLASARLDWMRADAGNWRAQGLGPDPLLQPQLERWLPFGAALPPGFGSQLRGLDRTLLGDQVLKGTLELRYTLGKPRLFRVAGLGNGRLSLAPYADLARVSRRDRQQPGLAAEGLWTSGIEAQVDLRLGQTFLFALGLGYGGEKLDWIEEDGGGRWYGRFHLGRPF